MSSSLGKHLPPPLLAALGPTGGAGLAVSLVSASTGGWPHVALLSIGELWAVDEQRLRIALWPGSTAAVNLGQVPRATLSVVVAGVGYSVRLETRHVGPLSTPWGSDLAVFDARVDEVRGDTAPYAVLESGIRFRLVDPAETLPRWQWTRHAMRDLVIDD
jgi:hypothetical protein